MRYHSSAHRCPNLGARILGFSAPSPGNPGRASTLIELTREPMTKMLLKPKRLIVHHHLGVGDHLICNGLVNYLLEAFELECLYLVCTKTNAPTVRFLYSDEPRITILEFNWPKLSQQDFVYLASNQLGVPVLTIVARASDNFDVEFYQSLGVPFDVRWSHFRLPAVMTSAHDFYRQHIRHERYCLVAAKTLVNNGAITATGGAGGNGVSAANNAGGGGGGGGGVVVAISRAASLCPDPLRSA